MFQTFFSPHFRQIMTSCKLFITLQLLYSTGGSKKVQTDGEVHVAQYPQYNFRDVHIFANCVEKYLVFIPWILTNILNII